MGLPFKKNVSFASHACIVWVRDLKLESGLHLNDATFASFDAYSQSCTRKPLSIKFSVIKAFSNQN